MTCPICSKETDPKYRPFCSRRCADIDLGKWLTGAYTVPAEEDEDWAEDTAPPHPDDPERPH